MIRPSARQLTFLLVLGCVAQIVVNDGLCRSALAGPISDKALEAVLRTQVFEKRDKTDELTEEDLKKVYVVKEGVGKGIKDLTGIDKCVNLLELNLSKNEITDLTPLKEIKNLQSLDLSKNKIADVGPLANVTALQFLELSDNQIVSVDPLAKLSKLSALYISGNKIADPAPLAGLNRLWTLDLARNKITDIKGLTNAGILSTLKLSDNQISDLSPLSKPLSAKLLLLERNTISDLAPLVAAVKADAEGEKRFAPFLRLHIAGNPLSEEAKLKQLEALKAAGVKIDPVEKK